MAATTTYTLNTGAKIPVLGLGTWKSEPGKVKAAVEAAIDAGYRHIDTAYLYGNEKEIGDAVQVKVKEGVVKREDLFITTKIWPTFYKRIEETISDSLRLLQVDYVDLYLMHWPFALQHTSPYNDYPVDEKGNGKYDESIHYIEVWRELEKIQKSGRIKALGVSNFNEFQIEKLWNAAEIKPALHQFELNPDLDQSDMIRYCKSKGIIATGYSPFGSPDRPWATSKDKVMLDDPIIKKLSDKYGKTPAQVVLRYLLQLGAVVIPKSITPARIQSNAEIFDFTLSEEDVATIRAMDRKFRIVDIPTFKAHRYYPFKENYVE